MMKDWEKDTLMLFYVIRQRAFAVLVVVVSSCLVLFVAVNKPLFILLVVSGLFRFTCFRFLWFSL